MNKIFFSYSKPKNIQQDSIIKYIKDVLQQEGLSIIEVQSERYDVSPLFVISEAIKKCDFFICIAYEKESFITSNGTILYHTSPWLDIEITLAVSYQIPFFIIKEEKLAETALLNSSDSLYYYSLPNTREHLMDFKYLQETIIPQLIKCIKTALH